MKKPFICLFIIFILLASLTVGSTAKENTVISVNGEKYTDFAEGWNAAIEASLENTAETEVILFADWIASDGSFGEGVGFKNGAILIPEGVNALIFDLNGYAVDRGLFRQSNVSSAPETDTPQKNGEVIHIDAQSENVTLKNGTVQGANNLNYGGIYIDKAENILFENVSLRSNKSVQGGAVYNNEGKISFNNCIFKFNQADYGGALYSDSDTVILKRCSFESNLANIEGGAIYSRKADITVSDSFFIGNKALKSGGALYTNGGDASFTESKFDGNIAESGEGGAIYHGKGTLFAEDCDFHANEATNYDPDVDSSSEGGACSLNAAANFYGCTFRANKAHRGGGCEIGGKVSFTDCKFISNTSAATDTVLSGSAILIRSHGEGVTLIDCDVQNNQGGCAIFVGYTASTAKLSIGGLTTVKNNFNPAGQEVNVVCTLGASSFAKLYARKDLSPDSRIGLAISESKGRSYQGHRLVSFESPFDKATLAKIFTLDQTDAFGESTSPHYLALTQSLVLRSGNYKTDPGALLNNSHSDSTGAMYGESGSLLFLFLIIATVFLFAAIGVTQSKKKKEASEEKNSEEDS